MSKPKSGPAKTDPAHETESFRGWKIRYVLPRPGATNAKPFWQADNCDRNDRKRASFPTKKEALRYVTDHTTEREMFGTALSLDEDVRLAAQKAVKVANGRASLDEIVQFWADRHPDDGDAIQLGEMISAFLAAREKQGNRPATIRELRWKLAAFSKFVGSATPVSKIWEGDLERFLASRRGAKTSVRAWKKALSPFFHYCQKDRKAIKTNPALSLVVPRNVRKLPVVWDVDAVKKFMKIAEVEAPAMVAGFAILWWAGLRPTELAGQYALENPKITEAKKMVSEAKSNYEAEKMRLGLVRGRGGDTPKQAANREILNSSAQAQELKKAREKLTLLLAKHGGAVLPGLQWKDICLDDPDDKFISVRAETSKVQEPRHVEILPNLERWLRCYRKPTGPVVANPTSFRRARDRILEKMEGAQWSTDVCRHTFASYHYKHFCDRDRLAAMMGHSAMSRQIEVHYKSATVSKTDADSFWKIEPKAKPR